MLRSLLGASRADRSFSTAGDLPPLHHQVRGGDLSGLKKLADRAAAPSLSTMLTAADTFGRNSLHAAAETGNEDVLKYLLKTLSSLSVLTVTINAKDKAGCTPLFTACRAGSRKCATELVKAGAEVSIADEKSNSVMHAPFLAPFLSKGHATVMKTMLTLLPNAPVNATNSEGYTPCGPTVLTEIYAILQLACQKGAYDCALLLLAAKADTTLVKGGDPPLFYAIATDNATLVSKLLNAGADVAQPNRCGQTLMEVLNPKCEIYRVIKQFLVHRPGGQRKMHLISEEVVCALGVTDLPVDVQKVLERSGLSRDEVQANWTVFCSVIRSVAKKKIVATTEEYEAAKKKLIEETPRTDDGRTADVSRLSSALLTSGEPQKIFKQMRVAGRGGFGMVFQGVGPDKKPWAIKRMPHNSAEEKLANLREANFLRECNHRNICAYKAAFESAAEHEMWLIMELLEGGTLDESVGNASEEAKHYFEERHLAYTAGEILKALEYLHEQNIVHRDLKSQNVMFTVSGEVKLIDFGAAAVITDSAGRKEMIGSPFWMPPEMILRQPHGSAADIWSMAVCLLELANHRAPDSSSMLRHMFHVATGQRPWLDRPDNWSELFRDFLDQSLQCEPSKRQRATVLLHHKWVVSKACSQAEMQRVLHRIFDVRSFADV